MTAPDLLERIVAEVPEDTPDCVDYRVEIPMALCVTVHNRAELLRLLGELDGQEFPENCGFLYTWDSFVGGIIDVYDRRQD